MVPRAGAVVVVVLGLLGVISLWLMGLLLVGLIAVILIDFYLTLRTIRRNRVAAGAQALLGRTAVARTPLSPAGLVFIDGERWRAEIEDGYAAPGERVRVVGADGLSLRVEHEHHRGRKESA
jgi:membrane protein implicated in regulation of membrane protease activity